MKKIKYFILSLILLMLAVAGGFGIYSRPCWGASPNNKFKAGEFLVKFKNDQKVYKFNVSAEADINAIIKKYQQNSEMEFIEPNYVFKAAAFPSDPDYLRQWYLMAINARDEWSKELLVREQEKITRQSIIAILDTGVFLDHPDLKDKIWSNSGERKNDKIDNDKNGFTDDINGWDFVDNDADPNPSATGIFNEDAVNHGTIVSGIAAASTNNQEGIAGTSWFSQIMPLRVLDNSGAGDVYSVIQAINYAVDNGADVINMSFVGDSFSQSLYNAIKRAYDKGVFVVAAAGNTDPKINGVNMDASPSYPVCFKGANGENLVIGVASVGKNLKKSNFSSYGSCVDISAPGEEFYAAQYYQSNSGVFDKYYNGYWSGTSLAAPLVSGAIASLKALRPGFSVEEIDNFVLKNTKDIYSYNLEYLNKLGTGLLDYSKALEAALQRSAPKIVKGQNDYLIAGLGLGSFPQVRIFRPDGTVFKEFYAFSPYFKGSINITAGDVNGDSINEVIAAVGSSGEPEIRVFDVNGHLLAKFLAFDKTFRGGVNIATGDVNGDKVDEIIATPGKGVKPEVRIFDNQGKLLFKFFAFDEKFTGGVKVCAADFNRDGRADIAVGPGFGVGPQVRIFDSGGKVFSQFFAFNQLVKGGVNIACGDVHGDEQPEIIATMEKDATPEVRIFTYLGGQLDSFYAYPPDYYKGMNLCAGDMNNDGLSEIITGSPIGTRAQLKAFDRKGMLKFEFFAHNQNYLGGVRPAVIRY